MGLKIVRFICQCAIIVLCVACMSALSVLIETGEWAVIFLILLFVVAIRGFYKIYTR